jgi:pimeloyl-ACP methyl ester carboxylesterase
MKRALAPEDSELEAPKKEKVIFERGAHMIPFEEPECFNREVVRVFAPSLPQ